MMLIHAGFRGRLFFQVATEGVYLGICTHVPIINDSFEKSGLLSMKHT